MDIVNMIEYHVKWSHNNKKFIIILTEMYFSVMDVVIFSLSQSLSEAVRDKDLYPVAASSPLQKPSYGVSQLRHQSKGIKEEEFILERLL